MEGVSVDPRPLSVSDVSLQGASLTQPGPTSQSRDLHTSPWPCPWGSCARTSLRTQRHRTACTSPAQRQSQHTSCLQHPKYHLLLLISPRKRGACRRHKPSLAQVQSTDAPTPSWPAFIPCATSIPLTEPSVLVSQRRGFSKNPFPLTPAIEPPFPCTFSRSRKRPTLPLRFSFPIPTCFQKNTECREASTKALLNNSHLYTTCFFISFKRN